MDKKHKYFKDPNKGRNNINDCHSALFKKHFRVWYVFFIITILTSGVIPAQELTYIISGKMVNLKAPAKIYLLSQQYQLLDSASLKNGSYSFNGKLENPRQVTIVLDRKGIGYNMLIRSGYLDSFDFYLENGEIVITSQDSLAKSMIKGGSVNTEFQEYKKSAALAIAQQASIYEEYSRASIEKKESKDFRLDIERRLKPLNDEITKIQKTFIQQNPNSYVSIDLLKYISGLEFNLEVVEPLFNNLSEGVRNSKAGIEYADQIGKIKKTALGVEAPDFSQKNEKGNEIKLSNLRGTYVLLDFWASWCKPCRAENPNIVKAYNQFKNKNFTILSVSLDSEKTKDAWLKAIETDQLTWLHVSDLNGWNNRVAQLYLIRSIPQNFLINPEGKIIAKNLSGEDLYKKLEEIFPIK